MRRLAMLFCGLVLAASLAACGQGEAGSVPGAAGSGPVEGSSAWESSASSGTGLGEPSALDPSALAGKMGPGPQEMEMQVFVQKDSGAEEGYEPTIRLLENGNFELSLYLYDGTALLSGTYAEEGDGYVLTPTESTAQGFTASGVGEIRLAKTEGGVIYSGEQLGVTVDGAEFLAEEG